MSLGSRKLIPTRRSLLNRLKDWNDQESWQTFFDTYGGLIYGAARKAGLTDAEAEDVVQETTLTVAKQMPHFQYDPAVGSFKRWLLQVVHSRIADLWRKMTYQKDGQRRPREETLRTSVIESRSGSVAGDLEQIWEAEWEKNLLRAATQRVKHRVDPRQYQMFDLHVLRRLSVGEVATLFGVKPAEVYAAKYRISAAIKREIQRLEQRGF